MAREDQSEHRRKHRGDRFGHPGPVTVEGPQGLPRFEPMLATLATLDDADFDDPAWEFEIKWDGVRALAYVAAGETLLRTRTGRDITHAYPELERLDRAVLAQEAVLDGEIVALDERGVSDFGRLQPRINLQDPAGARRAARAVPASYEVFDLLYADGDELTGLPLAERRERLERLLQPTASVRLSGTLQGGGRALYALAAERGLEGIMAKRRDSRYLAGKRSRDWRKLKVRPSQEMVVGGWTEGTGSRRRSFGALLLGYHDGDDLLYAGHTGTGFTEAMLRDAVPRLHALETDRSPFRTRPRPNRPVHWVRPELVCEVEFANWTRDGRLRAPSFKGFRTDKDPRDVVREQPGKAPPQLGLTNLDKVFWPQEGIAKGDLVDYYRRIAPVLLPHLRDRPMVLNRFPNGWQGKSFFQKDAPEHRPAWVETVGIPAESTGKEIDYVLCPDQRHLLWLANLGCIEMNPWLSSLPHLAEPDLILFDLDPEPPAGFAEAVEVARLVKRVLDQVGLSGYPKTSGATGMHVFVPVERGLTFEVARLFAEQVARGLAAAHRDLVTVAAAKAKRSGRVLVDYRQNGQGKTLASVYSVRPRAGAPVSTPLAWREVSPRLDPARFTMKRVLDRVRRRGDLFAPVLSARQEIQAAVELLGEIEY